MSFKLPDLAKYRKAFAAASGAFAIVAAAVADGDVTTVETFQIAAAIATVVAVWGVANKS